MGHQMLKISTSFFLILSMVRWRNSQDAEDFETNRKYR